MRVRAGIPVSSRVVHGTLFDASRNKIETSLKKVKREENSILRIAGIFLIDLPGTNKFLSASKQVHVPRPR